MKEYIAEYIVPVVPADEKGKNLKFDFTNAKRLIQCKDCKYSKPIDSEWFECQHDKRCMKENGFCSWAERK